MRRGRFVFGAIVAVLLLACVMLALTLRQHAHTAPTTGATTTDGPSKASTNSTIEPTTDSTTQSTQSTLEATSVATAATPTGEPVADGVAIPLAGGDTLEPTALVTVPFGDQPGHIALQNGELSTPTAVLPDQLLAFESTPGAGLTGRVLIFDRRGHWQRDATINGIDGWYVNWLAGAPNGTLFVVLASNDQRSRLVALRLSGDRFVTVKSVELDNLDDGDFTLTPDGVRSGHGLAISVPTGVTEQPIVQIDADAATGQHVNVFRTVAGIQRWWTFDVELDATGAGFSLPQFDRFGDGAWYSELAGYSEAVQPFIALMSPGAEPHAYRLGPWTIEAHDDSQIVLSRVMEDGALELATVDARPAMPADSDIAAAPTPAPPCLASQLSVESGPMGDGAMGNHRVVVRVTNTSSSICELTGYPALEQVFADGRVVPLKTPHGTYFGEPSPQTLVDPSATVEFWIGTSLCDEYTGELGDGWRTFQLDLASGTSLRFANQADLMCGFSVSRFGQSQE
jgi:hypothetical protein